MSDLSLTLEALEQHRSQLSPYQPTSTTTSTAAKMELIFQHGPRYLGHELAVPEVGDHYALPQEGEGRATRAHGKASNCCPTSAGTARR